MNQTIQYPTVEPASRERVEKLLEDAVQNPLVILHASSGHGKTQAVSSFLAHSREPVVWVHLSELENYEARFWKMFLRSVSEWSPGLAARLEGEPFPAALPAIHRFLELFSAEVYGLDRLILVFDDFQVLEEGPVRTFVQRLIHAAIENLSIVLISGTVVSSSLAGEVRTVRLTDRHLRFTREEIRVFYGALKIQLGEEALEQIFRFTEGWAFAVYLMGVHLVREQPLSCENVEDSIAYLFDILDRDIFSLLPQRVQRAASLLSLLPDFSAELAVETTGVDRRDLLEFLAGMPLVSMRGQGALYCFHRLLLQFLEHKRLLLDDSEQRGFLRRAAEWYERHGALLETLSCRLRAGDYSEMERILVQRGSRLEEAGTTAALLALMDQVPREYLEAHPMLELVRISLLFFQAEQPVEEELSHFLQRMDACENDACGYRETARWARGEALILQALLLLRKGARGFAVPLRQACELLPRGSALINGRQMPFLCNGSAIVPPAPGQGTLLEQLDDLFEAMPWAERLLGGFGYGLEHLAAAETHYYLAQLDKAELYAYQAVAKGKEREQWDIVCNAYYFLMRIGLARGRLSTAEESLHKLKEYARRCSGYAYFVLPDLAEGAFHLKIGYKAKISRWIVDDDVNRDSRILAFSGRELVIKAGYLLADHRYLEAQAFLDASIRHCRQNGQWFSALKMQILRAIGYDLMEDRKQAAKQLETAYSFSQPSGILMPYIEYGKLMVNLIIHIREEPHAIPLDWLELVWRKAGTYARYQSGIVKEYGRLHGLEPAALDKLTEREREILLLVCQGMRNEEIANMLALQTGTVKNTLKRIYPKIGAVNRADAVRIVLEETLR